MWSNLNIGSKNSLTNGVVLNDGRIALSGNGGVVSIVDLVKKTKVANVIQYLLDSLFPLKVGKLIAFVNPNISNLWEIVISELSFSNHVSLLILRNDLKEKYVIKWIF